MFRKLQLQVVEQDRTAQNQKKKYQLPDYYIFMKSTQKIAKTINYKIQFEKGG